MNLRPFVAVTSLRRLAIAALTTTMALLAAAPAAAQLDFFAVDPCRVYDSRGTDGPLDMGQTFSAQTSTNGILVAGVCGVAADAVAAAFNVTIVGATEAGELVVFPAGQAAPTAGALSFSAGRTLAMFEIVELGNSGGFVGRVDALATVTPPTNPGPDQYQLIVDVTGYFRAPDAPEVTTTAGTTAFTEDGGAVVVDGGVTVTDPDDTNLESATVSLTSAPDGAAETLNATLGNDARYRALAEEDHQIQEALRQFPRAAEILALRKGERVDPRVAEREAAEVQSEPLQR